MNKGLACSLDNPGVVKGMGSSIQVGSYVSHGSFSTVEQNNVQGPKFKNANDCSVDNLMYK